MREDRQSWMLFGGLGVTAMLLFLCMTWMVDFTSDWFAPIVLCGMASLVFAFLSGLVASTLLDSDTREDRMARVDARMRVLEETKGMMHAQGQWPNLLRAEGFDVEVEVSDDLSQPSVVVVREG